MIKTVLNIEASILVWAFDQVVGKMELLWLNNYKEIKENGYEIKTDVISNNLKWNNQKIVFDIVLVKK